MSLAVPRPGRLAAAAGGTAPSRRRARAVALALLAVALFTAYLNLSRTASENSDEANILLMASDMLHGNVLLHGWHTSDVPFITTELPQIALLVAVFGLRLSTAHIAAAMTYTLVVLAAMALARGRAVGRPAMARMLLALAIMVAPQPGVGVFVLVFSVGHIGTALPVMLAWLALERLAPGTSRRAVIAAALLTWALVADPLVTVIAVIPLGAVAAVRRDWRLLAAAGTAYLAAQAAARLITALGGYVQKPVPYAVTPPGTWLGHARTAAHGLLAMFGAYPGPGLPALDAAIAAAHLAGVALAAWAVLAAGRRFPCRDADLVTQLLLAGIIANLAAYLPSSLASASALNAREFAPVLPFAAVLVARGHGDRAAAISASRARLAVPLAGLLALAYCLGLAVQAARPPAANPYARIEAFLRSHHLTHGLSGYWDSSVITVDSGATVTIRPVIEACLQPYLWEARPDWFTPSRRHPATFILASTAGGYFGAFGPQKMTVRQLAAWLPPPRRYDSGGTHLVDGTPAPSYTALAYRADLLAELPRLKAALQTPAAPCQ
jgi:hypothetical protein